MPLHKKTCQLEQSPDHANVPPMTMPYSIPVNCLSYQRLALSNLVSQLPSCVHNNVSLSDADVSFVSISSFSSAITSSTTVSCLSFHSMVSNNIPSSLVPAYTSPASSQIQKIFQEMISSKK